VSYMQRWICQPGTIVHAKAGRDAGRFFIVVGLDGADLLLSDGERRTFAHPKRKNPAHVQATKTVLPLEALTDKAIRQALKPFNQDVSAPQTKQNQIRKEVIDDVETGCN